MRGTLALSPVGFVYSLHAGDVQKIVPADVDLTMVVAVSAFQTANLVNYSCKL